MATRRGDGGGTSSCGGCACGDACTCGDACACAPPQNPAPTAAPNGGGSGSGLLAQVPKALARLVRSVDGVLARRAASSRGPVVLAVTLVAPLGGSTDPRAVFKAVRASVPPRVRPSPPDRREDHAQVAGAHAHAHPHPHPHTHAEQPSQQGEGDVLEAVTVAGVAGVPKLLWRDSPSGGGGAWGDGSYRLLMSHQPGVRLSRALGKYPSWIDTCRCVRPARPKAATAAAAGAVDGSGAGDASGASAASGGSAVSSSPDAASATASGSLSACGSDNHALDHEASASRLTASACGPGPGPGPGPASASAGSSCAAVSGGGVSSPATLGVSRFRESVARMVAVRLMGILSRLHAMRVVHGGVSAHSVLVGQVEGRLSVSLVSFGAAHMEEHCMVPQQRLGAITIFDDDSLTFAAPEVLAGARSSRQSDCYSAGVLVAWMLTGCFPPVAAPMAAVSPRDADTLLASPAPDLGPPVCWAGVSDRAQDFVRGLLQQGAATRLMASQALQHPWLAGADSEVAPTADLPDASNKSAASSSPAASGSTFPAFAAPAAARGGVSSDRRGLAPATRRTARASNNGNGDGVPAAKRRHIEAAAGPTSTLTRGAPERGSSGMQAQQQQHGSGTMPVAPIVMQTQNPFAPHGMGAPPHAFSPSHAPMVPTWATGWPAAGLGSVSPMHGIPSPMHGVPSPMHGLPSPMHGVPSPMHRLPSPIHAAMPMVGPAARGTPMYGTASSPLHRPHALAIPALPRGPFMVGSPLAAQGARPAGTGAGGDGGSAGSAVRPVASKPDSKSADTPAIIRLDSEGIIVSADSRALHFIGLGPGDEHVIKGRSLAEMAPAASLQYVTDVLQAVRVAGSATNIHLQLRQPDSDLVVEGIMSCYILRRSHSSSASASATDRLGQGIRVEVWPLGVSWGGPPVERPMLLIERLSRIANQPTGPAGDEAAGSGTDARAPASAASSRRGRHPAGDRSASGAGGHLGDRADGRSEIGSGSILSSSSAGRTNSGGRGGYSARRVMVHSIDSKGVLHNVNDVWLEVMGYTRSEVVGRKSTDFLTAGSRQYARDVVLPEFMRTGQCVNIHYQWVTKSGRVLNSVLNATSERNSEGQMLRSLAVITVTGFEDDAEDDDDSDADSHQGDHHDVGE